MEIIKERGEKPIGIFVKDLHVKVFLPVKNHMWTRQTLDCIIEFDLD